MGFITRLGDSGILWVTLTALLLAGAVVFALDLLQRRRRVDWA